jgi:hypothetical protein
VARLLAWARRRNRRAPASKRQPRRPPNRLKTAAAAAFYRVHDPLKGRLRNLAVRKLGLHLTGPTGPLEWERPTWPGHLHLMLPEGKTKPIFPNEAIFDPLIREASATYGVPVPLIKAFVATESSFNPRAIKQEPHVKAPQYGIDGDASRGLMQILLSTARDRGFTGEAEELFDPRTNLLVAVKHLRWLFEKYKDDDRVIAAYNAGSPRMSKSRPGEFENQVYVSRVKGFLRQFEKAEGAGTILASLAWPLLIGLALALLRQHSS